MKRCVLHPALTSSLPEESCDVRTDQDSSVPPDLLIVPVERRAMHSGSAAHREHEAEAATAARIISPL